MGTEYMKKCLSVTQFTSPFSGSLRSSVSFCLQQQKHVKCLIWV